MKVQAAGKKKGYEMLAEGASAANADGAGEEPTEQRNPLSEPLTAHHDPDTVPITILSQTGAKHKIRVNLAWNVSRLKELVATEAGVEKILQRLIFHGRILDDSKILTDYKIQAGCTVHLFARLRSSLAPLPGIPPQAVQINDTSTGNEVPVIAAGNINALAQQAAFREIQGHDIFANMQLQHYARRVKLWSVLLLIWSATHLFNAAVLLADPNYATRGRAAGDDDFHHNDAHATNQHEMRPHVTPLENTVDLFVNMAGVYVGLAGFRASTRLDAQLGLRYQAGLVGLLVLWAVAGIVRLVEAQKQGILTNPSNQMMGVIILIGLPSMMWGFCVVQARRFRLQIESTERANRQQQQSMEAVMQAQA